MKGLPEEFTSEAAFIRHLKQIGVIASKQQL
jgi:hypothetical protein